MLLYVKVYLLLLYKSMYNKIFIYHSIRRYITTTNILIIYETVFLLYKKMYNEE